MSDDIDRDLHRRNRPSIEFDVVCWDDDRDAGFRDVKHVSADALTARYFADRADGLRMPSNSEELLVART